MGLCTYRDAVLIIPPLALPSPRQPTGHDSPEGGIDVPNRPGRARAMSVAGRQAHWQRGRPARGEPCPAQRSLQVQQAAMGTCGRGPVGAQARPLQRANAAVDRAPRPAGDGGRPRGAKRPVPAARAPFRCEPGPARSSRCSTAAAQAIARGTGRWHDKLRSAVVCIRSETAGGVIAQEWYQYRSRLGGDSTTARYSAPPGADGIEPHVV